eukprot:UN20300
MIGFSLEIIRETEDNKELNEDECTLFGHETDSRSFLKGNSNEEDINHFILHPSKNNSDEKNPEITIHLRKILQVINPFIFCDTLFYFVICYFISSYFLSLRRGNT